jgi:hypothetical protein
METLDKHFRELTRAAFARHGFAQGELIGRWPEIVGEELSRVCEPERIKWPRGTGENAQKTGGTLVIRAAPGRGLDLQYESPRIIERLNRFHGYGAIAAVKIVQAGTWPAGGPPQAPASPPNKLFEQELAAIADEDLRAALERLGAAVAAAAQGSPQGK